jgi:thioredoxin 1
MPPLSAEPRTAKSPVTRAVLLALLGVGALVTIALRPAKTVEPAIAPPATTGARLVELGSTSCASCKAMHEELAKLRDECRDTITVDEIDVWKDEDAARRYGVRVIPTQILFDGEGRELDRHVGFLARNDIRDRFARHGTVCR